ncbi:MAG TPA: YlxR family protein [Candidatus Dormibacteraeota bacterium]|jgi:predicted RNA-binding protein YlxR (DUF448 family)|nr:YlxR family protein [Candidatus Dormibacteraeota bacterium]
MSAAVPPSVPTGAGPEAAPGATPPDRRPPQRTCVGCRQVRAKRELARLVLPAEGPVQVDPTGKRNGRGAYICRETGRTCLEQARKRRALTRALRTTADHIDYEALATELDSAAPRRY